jgi:hypothetical protein
VDGRNRRDEKIDGVRTATEVRGTKAEALDTLRADDVRGADMLWAEEDTWE